MEGLVKVFVTGATGFVGSYVVRALIDRGHDVYALATSSNNTWRIADVKSRIAIVEADLRELENYLPQIGPQAVVHLAWAGVANTSRNDAAQFQNVELSVRLAELSAKCGVAAFVGVGSQAEYGLSVAPTREDAETKPTTYYGIAKLAAYMGCEQACKSTGTRFAWARIFSSYGPRDHDHWLIPYLTNALLRRERPALTAAEQVWDFIYVTDAADAIVSLVECDEASGSFNIGSGRARPLRGIIEAIRDSVDPSLELGFGEVPYRPDQVMRLEADIAKLQTTTRWEPKVALEEGIAATVSFYRERLC